MLIVVLSAVSFLLGVALATLTGWAVPGFIFFVGVGLLWWRPQWGAVLIAFLLGFARLQLWQEQVPSADVLGKNVIEATLEEDWGKKDGKWNWLVSTDEGELLLETSAYLDLKYGETVELKGVVETTEALSQNVSYLHYLQRHRVWLVMENPRLTILAPPPISFLGSLAELSDRLTARLQVLLSEPEASFAVGLLLGKRQNMDADLQTAFQTVGLTHIVAISGSNIAMVVVCFFVLFSFLPFQKRLICSGVGVLCFVLLVGPSAAVLRAGLMGILSLVGLYTGRRSQAFFGLLWSAVLMVIVNPLVLTYDVGFQLSFASTLGILTLTPVLEPYIPERIFMREALLLTLAAQLMTFPFIVFYFGRFSWITLPANLLVAPLIPLAMAASAAALIFGTPAAALAWTFLWLIEKIALFCAAVPGVQIELTASPLFFITMLISLAFSLLFFYKSKLDRAFLRGYGARLSKELNRECEMRERR